MVIKMKVEVLEKESNKVKIKIDDLTFASVLNEELWENKAETAAFAKEHPYIGDPVILVKAKNPKKVFTDAAASVEKQAAELRKKMSSVLK